MTLAEPPFDGREMEMMHKMFRREFALMPGLVQNVPDGHRERTQVVADHLAFVNTALHNHHHFEDTFVWPLLLTRGAEDIAPHVRTVQQQHERIERASAEVERALEPWRADAGALPRDRLSHAIDELLPLLTEHMSVEEQYVVPIIEKHVTLAEWNRLLQAGVANVDPTGMPLEFGMMMYEGDPDIVQATISTMPAELRSVIEQIAAEAFASHAELIHGTATPSRSIHL
jgi:hemerythrin-like domain-containing protein